MHYFIALTKALGMAESKWRVLKSRYIIIVTVLINLLHLPCRVTTHVFLQLLTTINKQAPYP